ncbi:hypothetical protein Tco_0659656 [Tanacetum coccineum]
MEHELWNLKVKDFDITAYTKRFHEWCSMSGNGHERTQELRKCLIEDVRMAFAMMGANAQARIEGLPRALNGIMGNVHQGGNNACELGTFDVVIGMDWLVDQDAVIVCGKKRTSVVRGNFVTEKEPKEKRLEDVPVIRDFPEVFPD